MEPAIEGKRKRSTSRGNDYSKCLVCQTVTDQNGPIRMLTKVGLNTFRNAVQTRHDDVYDRIWEDIQDESFLAKKPVCHQNCRAVYTLKRSVDALEPSTSKKPKDDGEARRPSRQSIDYKSVCFLCEKERDSKGDRKLTLIATKERQDKVHKKAKELQDEALLRKIEGFGDAHIDFVAYDFRYHTKCMNQLLAARGKSDTGRENSSVSVHEKTFQKLLSEISGELFVDRHAYYISQLSKRYRKLLQEVTEVENQPYRSDRLKKKLLKHFGEDIQLVELKRGETLICASSLSVKELCAEVVALKSEVDECQLLPDEFDAGDLDRNVSSTSYPLAKHLRTEIKGLEKRTMREPAGEDKISYQGAANLVPLDLYNLLAWLLTDSDESVGEDGRVQLSTAEDERVLNLAQDIVSSLTRLPLPKHIGVAMHILKSTRSKSLVTMVNRFGNCVSYNTAQRYITTVANEVSEREERDGLFIPTNIVPGQFLQCALDNLNFHSETEDGGSLDATTNIIYQSPGSQDETVVEVVTVPRAKTRETSVKPPEKFVPVTSMLTLKDRKQARSLCGVPIGADGEQIKPGPLADANVVWFLLRMFPTQLLSSENDSESDSCSVTWNAFFEVHSGKRAEKTNIGYGPLFPETPTKADVVQTSLDYFISLSLKLGQEKTVVTCDQAIYDIIKGLVVKHSERYKDVIVRLGGFHIATNFLGSIGFFMKESGIEDILVLSGICGRGTANKVMAGKDFYKMVRYHSFVCEAMFMLKWEAFESWCIEEGEVEHLSSLASLLERLRNATELKDRDEVVRLSDETLQVLRSLEVNWANFEKTQGLTAQLWRMYIDMVLILKRYIHAERAGVWEQHLQEVENMLPYTVSSGHGKYMSCLPIYLNDMRGLPVSAPDVHEKFESGEFNVHQIAGDFNGVWTDLALEQTYNKEGKTSLFKGIIQAESAREKYIKTLPFMTSVSESVKQMVHMTSPEADHHDKLNKDDHEQVLKIKRIIQEKMRNPFSPNLLKDKLVNISTGETLGSTKLIEARKLGLEAMRAADTSDSEKISMPKIATFANQQKKGKKKRDNAKAVISEENAVTRALCFTQDLSDEGRIDAFSHEWLEYPPALYDHDGHNNCFVMRKGTKADFFDKIQSEVSEWETVKELPPKASPTIYVIDAMAFIQRYQTLGVSTFGELQESYRRKLMAIKPAGCNKVHFVGDQYDFGVMSLKGDERQRRGSRKTSSEYVPADTLKIPDWKTFLSNPSNKTNLLKYLSESWSKSTVPDGITIVIAVDAQTVQVSSYGVSILEELYCPTHEEADTRIFAHMAKFPEGCRVVVQATDTDILMLCLYHYPRLENIEQLWVEKLDTFLPIHDLVKELARTLDKDSLEITETLLVAYVLSGCDSVSYPYKRGKKRAAKVALQQIGKMVTFANFEPVDVSDVDEKIFDEAREFFCRLYSAVSSSSLNELRAHLFASSKQDIRSLPPTEDAFRFHVLRSLAQFSLYKQACLSNPTLLPPEHYGRQLENGALVPVMKSLPAKPKTAKLHFCKCKSTPLCQRNCPCRKLPSGCIIACPCNGKPDICGLRITYDDNDDDADDNDD